MAPEKLYIVPGLLRSLYKYRHHNVLPLHAQPRRKVIDTQIHWPGAMTAAHVSERVHSIRAQSKPYVSWFPPKILKFSINISPLDGISRMSKLSVLLALISVPTQQFCILWVCK